MSLNLLQALVFLGGLLGIGLSLILSFNSRYKGLSNRILSFFIASFSIVIMTNILEFQNALGTLTFLPLVFSATNLLFGPLISQYSISLINDQAKLKRKDYYHFLPAFIYLLLLATVALFGIESESDIDRNSWLVPLAIVIQVAIPLQLLGYIVATIIRIGNYHRWLITEYSDIEKLKLSWLRLMLIGFSTIYLVWVIVFGADIKALNLIHSRELLESFWLLLSIFVYWIGFYSFTHPEVLFLPAIVPQVTSNPLDERELLNYKEKLVSYMDIHKPYLDPSLNLNSLATQLNLNAKVLSHIINTGMQQTFYDYINCFRIEEIKNVLQKPENSSLKLEGVAYDCGIKSSSTFNRLFKKYVSMTPRQYRDSQKFRKRLPKDTCLLDGCFQLNIPRHQIV